MNPLNQYNQRSLHFLNATQFFGALNDNVFKLLIVYFLINTEGASSATTILSIVGAVFVVPFLLFSSAAGVIADKASKRTVIVIMKILEIIIMTGSLIGIAFKLPIFLYCLLFLMATQSAFFAPSKYGIIPEIVMPDFVSKANGILTSFTFLAIIIGTFLASFITDITHKNFTIAFILCIVIAISGFFTSLGIKKTEAKRSTKKINPLFVYEIYKTLALCYKRKYLLVSVIGAGFFLFLGGFTQLNTIPFAMQSLHLTAVGGGYLFLTTAVGIAIGSFTVGKLSKNQIKLNLSCLSGFVMSILLVLLGLFSHHLIVVIILLVLLGFFGGMFIVPFETFIQLKSPDIRRGQVIAASNFLSFCGVLLASFSLYLIGNILSLSSATGFIIMGVICFIFTFVISGRISDLFIPYFAEKLVFPFYSMKSFSLPPTSSLIIFEEKSIFNIIMLFSAFPNLKIILYEKLAFSSIFLRLFFNTIFFIKRKNINFTDLLKKANDLKEKNTHICLIINRSIDIQSFIETFHSYKDNVFDDILFIHSEKHDVPMSFMKITYKKKMLSFTFTKKNF